MRWIIIAIILLYALPVGLYVALFRRFSFGIDMIFGAFSFLFFSPTYLNILNIYALSRINDISWGTKGLDADVSNKNSNLQ
jgi:cellulose synthase/poly-beta-1,6-N-acetylglucosamine synthase-like glycosyltransferase